MNIGTRLYQKGIKKQEEKERYCKEEKEKKEKQAEEGLIFKPILRAKSKEKSMGRNPAGVKKENELLEYGKQLQERREKARKEMEEQSVRQFGYKP